MEKLNDAEKKWLNTKESQFRYSKIGYIGIFGLSIIYVVDYFKSDFNNGLIGMGAMLLLCLGAIYYWIEKDYKEFRRIIDKLKE